MGSLRLTGSSRHFAIAEVTFCIERRVLDKSVLEFLEIIDVMILSKRSNFPLSFNVRVVGDFKHDAPISKAATTICKKYHRDPSGIQLNRHH